MVCICCNFHDWVLAFYHAGHLKDPPWLDIMDPIQAIGHGATLVQVSKSNIYYIWMEAVSLEPLNQ